MWVGQTGRGWGSAGGKEFGIQQVVWDGRTMPFAMHDLKLTEKGFRIVFTKPVDPEVGVEPDNYLEGGAISTTRSTDRPRRK